MDLTIYYDNLWEKSLLGFQNGIFELDNLIKAKEDKRFGITLLARPSKEVKSKIQQFLAQLRSLEPHQYYYPETDIHITVMSIISCYEGFSLSSINVQDYIALIDSLITGMKKIPLVFKGITASPSCIMIQGFPEDNSLDMLRDNIRTRFGNTSLKQTMDNRYVIKTAHATVMRFSNPLLQPAAFLSTLQEYKNFYFGSSLIEEIELVYNDWYQKADLVKVLHKFKLASP